MQDLGIPLIGDTGVVSTAAPILRALEALPLCKLCFYHPVTDQLMECRNPYPRHSRNCFQNDIKWAKQLFHAHFDIPPVKYNMLHPKLKN